ncbi:MAG TPA: hypothetical protein VFC44_01810 [Candidatus Saccharimonadales bacterium]|nr:hypothetical protein [Candidatus Saccharimonadales bacterium]
MTLESVEIPGIDSRTETVWKVRALVLNGKDPVRAALFRWSKTRPKDYAAIMKVMRLAAQQDHVRNPKHVKKSGNPQHGSVYEMIAYTSTARLMFFYDEAESALIISTNAYEKKGDQDAAFARCATLRDIYRERKKS